jgi:hypothetical protein
MPRRSPPALCVVLLGVVLGSAGCDSSSTPAGADAAVDAPTAKEDAPPAGEDASAEDAYVITGTCEYVADLLSQNGCDLGKACDLQVSGGQLAGFHCRDTGSTEDYGHCSMQADCRAGTSCLGGSQEDAACSPYCDASTKAGCTGNGICATTMDVGAEKIGVCMSPDGCDLMSNEGCGEGQACVVISRTTFDTKCLQSGNKADGRGCQSVTDCMPGSMCNLTCLKWCEVPEDCTPPASCQHVGMFAPDLGVCYEPA